MWRDLLGRRPEPPPELSAALADLDRLASSRPELESPARSLGRVLDAAFGTSPTLARPYDFCRESPHFDDVEQRSGSGGTAFWEDPPAFDLSDLRSRAEAILKALKPANPAAGSLLRIAIDSRELADSTVVGNDRSIEAWALDAMLPVDLLVSVVRLTVLPVLAPLSIELARHRPEGLAAAGRCPHCGRPPALAESRGLEGLRFLRCGTCAADWPGRRLGCVACGEEDWRAVRTLSVEGEESRSRLIACESCGFRLKVVPTLAPLSGRAGGGRPRDTSFRPDRRGGAGPWRGRCPHARSADVHVDGRGLLTDRVEGPLAEDDLAIGLDAELPSRRGGEAPEPSVIVDEGANPRPGAPVAAPVDVLRAEAVHIVDVQLPLLPARAVLPVDLRAARLDHVEVEVRAGVPHERELRVADLHGHAIDPLGAAVGGGVAEALDVLLGGFFLPARRALAETNGPPRFRVRISRALSSRFCRA